MKLTEKGLRNLWCFLVETFEFTEEQTAAIDHQIPMTQELFDAILDRVEELEEDMTSLFFRLLEDYPEFMNERVDKIEKEVEEANLPTLPKEEWEIQRQKLFARIRAKYGEDII